jgi:hypothetical protein
VGCGVWDVGCGVWVVGDEWGNNSSKAFGVSVADRPKAKRFLTQFHIRYARRGIER